MSKRQRKFKARPKWGGSLPGLAARPGSFAERRQRVGGLLSNNWSRSGLAKLFRWLGGILGLKRKRWRPPPPPKEYTVDVK
jgi:hypothetical protein